MASEERKNEIAFAADTMLKLLNSFNVELTVKPIKDMMAVAIRDKHDGKEYFISRKDDKNE